MASAERIAVGGLLLAAIVVALAVGARRARAALMPEASGAITVVVDASLALAAFLTASHLLGALGLLYPLPLTSLCAAAGLAAWRLLPPPPPSGLDLRLSRERVSVASAIAAAPIAAVLVAWAARSLATLDRGTAGNVDTYWYHMPLAARFAAEHSIGGLFRSSDPVIGFYAADGSLLHAGGIVLLGSDFLSPLLNLSFLVLALLAAAAVGRASGAGLLAPAAISVMMLAPVMRVGQPGEAKDDIAVLALILAAAAVVASGPMRIGAMTVIGVLVGLVAGMKVTGLAAAIALGVGAIALAAPHLRRRGAAAMTLAAAVTGSTWYVRNLVETGSPVPFVELPGWDPPASPALDGWWSTPIVHYATDFGVWADWFEPGLAAMLGSLWFVLLAAAVAGVAIAVLRGPGAGRVLAAAAVVAFFAYVVSPTMAGGPEGQPGLFPFQIRHGLAATFLGLLAGGWAAGRGPAPVRAALAVAIAALGLVSLLAEGGAPPVPARALVAALAAVGAAVAIALAPQRLRIAAAGAALLLAFALLAARYRDGAYLRGDHAESPLTHTGPHAMHLIPLWEWARGIEESRIGVVGTFLQYPYYGAELSNAVEQVGSPLPHGGFDDVAASCPELIGLVDEGAFDYVVVTPPRIEFSEEPVRSPQSSRLDMAGAEPVLYRPRAGVGVFAIGGPVSCGTTRRPRGPERTRPTARSSRGTAAGGARGG